jgi:hypothetical protein
MKARTTKVSGKVYWMAGGLALLCAVAAAVAAILLRAPSRPPPDPADASPAETARFLASDSFRALPMREKRAYMERLREERRRRSAEDGEAGRLDRVWEELSEEDRENLRRNVRRVFMEMMQDAVDEYFELPEAERTAYLDERIDEFRARGGARRDPGGRPAGEPADRGGGGSSGRGRRGPTPERVSRMMRMTDPETRAKMIEFHRAMRERMEERGMSPPGGR